MNSSLLDTPIEYLKGVGPKRGDVLRKEARIYTFGDLLEYYPFRYIDKTELHTIANITPDMLSVQLKGVITAVQTTGEHRAKRLTALFNDGTGTVELVWFQGINFVKSTVKEGKSFLVFGRPVFKYNRLSIAHPEMQAADEETGFDSRLEPVYNTSDIMKRNGLTSRGIYRLVQVLFDKIHASDVPEILPAFIRSEYQLMARFDAFKNLHLPTDTEELQQARLRLKFEEFFFIQMRLLQLKQNRKTTFHGFVFTEVGQYFNHFYHHQLPFELTGAQKRVLKEIRKDTLTGHQMNRLVQGDVGSGKTIVALMTALLALDNGFQACIMAPTEILAQQHYNNISAMLQGMDIGVDLLTGSVKGKQRRSLLEKLELGITQILIGTHALIENTVVFKNLGLVVIDEQHRFGVAQRASLWEKNEDKYPHILVMTATPIPRTLAMTVYGDLDVSVIDELPPGRKPIQTRHVTDSRRLEVFEFMRRQIAEGRQIYVVYPLINESEALDYKDLMDGYESISRTFPMPQYQVSVVHGQMSAADKDWEMQRFKQGETHIMVATTVIEVGVDVPNASVMVIESAERFGLSQLHQLRGRVGRGASQSYCILISGHKLSNDGKTRMKTMTETTDGFKIAEVDLKLRGPGDIEGTQQSGLQNLKIADLVKDTKILQVARTAAAQLLHLDAGLSQPEQQPLKRYLEAQDSKTRSKWSKIS
ncbi:ATP-dependent DNA helicase RecG [Sphingobacteriales bacterium UPWRP_1]|nr:ATP-dependent DNA helicase RecG [Sphingobacteriales bacterium UPWRP_1]